MKFLIASGGALSVIYGEFYGTFEKIRKFVGGNRYLVLHSPDARTAFTKKYERPLIIPYPEKG